MLKNFQLHIDGSHFPGYKVTQPFYIYVQYSIEDGKFGGVKNVTIPFNAVGTLYNSEKFKREIEAAALNNFESLHKVKKTTADVIDHEAHQNLKSQITY